MKQQNVTLEAFFLNATQARTEFWSFIKKFHLTLRKIYIDNQKLELEHIQAIRFSCRNTFYYMKNFTKQCKCI
jgi:hypothetical protein